MDKMVVPNYTYMNYPGMNNQMFNTQQNDLMVVSVQGEAGANAYPVASGNTVLLIDFESNKFWLKSNVNGIPQRLRTFEFNEIIREPELVQPQNTPIITRDEFDALSRNVMTLSEGLNKLVSELGGVSNEQ